MDLAVTGEGEGCRRRGGGHRTAVGVSAFKSARSAVGDDSADEAVRGSGSEDRSFGRGRGTAEEDVASVNKAARTSVGHVFAVRHVGGRERNPPLRMRPSDGRGDHCLHRQVCVDGCGGCRHRKEVGREGVAAGADATRRLRGSSPLRRSLPGMPWGMLFRTRLPGGRGSGGPPRRAAAAGETTGWPRDEVSSVDEASQMTVWRTVTEEAFRGEGGVSLGCRRE